MVNHESKREGEQPNPEGQVERGGGSGSGGGAKDDTVTFFYPKSKIFVGGLDFKLTKEGLKDHFRQFGEVADAIILNDIFTGNSRGFGFVTFEDENVAQNLIRNKQVTEINGRRVDIKKAEPKSGGGGPPMRGGQGGGGGGGGFHGNNFG